MNYIAYKNEITPVHNYQSLTRTIDEMNIMELNSLKDKGFIEFMKNNFAYLQKEKNVLIIIYRLHNWIYENISFKKDKYDETLISPRIIIYIKHGDCDDFALLMKTMLSYFKIDSKYILLAKKENEFTHIANIYNYKNHIMYIDATMMKSEFPMKTYFFYKITG